MLVRIYDITKKKTVIKLLFLKCILFICFKKKKLSSWNNSTAVLLLVVRPVVLADVSSGCVKSSLHTLGVHSLKTSFLPASLHILSCSIKVNYSVCVCVCLIWFIINGPLVEFSCGFHCLWLHRMLALRSMNSANGDISRVYLKVVGVANSRE